MNYSFGAQSSFGSAVYLKKNTHPLKFSEDWLIWSSEKWQIFMCPLIKSVNAQQNMYSIQKKNSQRYSVLENHPNTDTNNIHFEKLPEYEYK